MFFDFISEFEFNSNHFLRHGEMVYMISSKGYSNISS